MEFQEILVYCSLYVFLKQLPSEFTLERGKISDSFTSSIKIECNTGMSFFTMMGGCYSLDYIQSRYSGKENNFLQVIVSIRMCIIESHFLCCYLIPDNIIKVVKNTYLTYEAKVYTAWFVKKHNFTLVTSNNRFLQSKNMIEIQIRIY